ncbi:Lipopolysaccharide export system ATP-binding protein LptB [bacterium HR30]|nr:Lipopolysaccharide export system ATP-binding protein LptB [bacterium HR30]
MPTLDPTLRGIELCKSYRRRVVVRNVSLEVRGGEIVGLLGPNGAGKTTTFHMLVGLVRPDSGQVLLNGEDIGQLPLYARARLGIGYLPQETSIFRKLTVEENLLAILETLPLTRAERELRAQELMEELGVRHVAKNKAFELSGGERRRVEIARALVTQPHFMLLDEPFAGIDPLAILDVQQIIGQLKQRGIGVLITDHNVRETLGICDRAYILAEGIVIEEGPPSAIASSERARSAYLGNRFQL